jgi:pyruvate dehydrogenase E2 component (dihydrolipoamide acetyltransferase)
MIAPAARGVKITPAARRRAADLGLDTASLNGTGVDGSVTLADVELAAVSPTAAAPAVTAPRLRPGRDAEGDRHGNGAVQTRDPALLPEPHN